MSTLGRWPREACRDEEPELFFPVGNTSKSDIAQIAEAKAVCAGCAALKACSAWTFDHLKLAEHGIWAGTDEWEREEWRRADAGLRNRRKRAAEKAARQVAASVVVKPRAAGGAPKTEIETVTAVNVHMAAAIGISVLAAVDAELPVILPLAEEPPSDIAA